VSRALRVPAAHLVLAGLAAGGAGAAAALAVQRLRVGPAAAAEEPAADPSPEAAAGEALASPAPAGAASARPVEEPGAPGAPGPPSAEALRELEAFLGRYRPPSRSSFDHGDRFDATQVGLRWIWLRRSAGAGDVRALIGLAEIVRDGDAEAAREEPTRRAAFDHFRLWAALREPDALEAVRTLAFEHGDALALSELALVAALDLAEVDGTALREGLAAAADRGSHFAALALAHLAGRGDDRRDGLCRAAEAGNPVAARELVSDLASRDPAEAVEWALFALEELGQEPPSMTDRAIGQLIRREERLDLAERAATTLLAAAERDYQRCAALLLRGRVRAAAGDVEGAGADLRTAARLGDASRRQREARQAREALAELGLAEDAGPASDPAAAAEEGGVDLTRLREVAAEPVRVFAPREDFADPAPDDEVEAVARAAVVDMSRTPEAVRFAGADGVTLEGDLFPRPGAPLAAVLVHQRGADRRSWGILARALHTLGYAVLAFDQREVDDPAERIRTTARDVPAACRLLRERGAGASGVALIGAGAGCSSVILAEPEVEAVFALVLLSPYANYAGVDVTEAAKRVDCDVLAVVADEDPGVEDGVHALLQDRAGGGGAVKRFAGDAHGTRLLTRRAPNGEKGTSLIGGGRAGIQLFNVFNSEQGREGLNCVEAFLKQVSPVR